RHLLERPQRELERRARLGAEPQQQPAFGFAGGGKARLAAGDAYGRAAILEPEDRLAAAGQERDPPFLGRLPPQRRDDRPRGGGHGRRLDARERVFGQRDQAHAPGARELAAGVTAPPAASREGLIHGEPVLAVVHEPVDAGVRPLTERQVAIERAAPVVQAREEALLRGALEREAYAARPGHLGPPRDAPPLSEAPGVALEARGRDAERR